MKMNDLDLNFQMTEGMKICLVSACILMEGLFWGAQISML